MTCYRCGGRMFWETIYSIEGKHTSLVCFNCGECIDEEIIKNRILSARKIRRKNILGAIERMVEK